MCSWSKHFLVEFIELFRREECLWKITSKDYRNKQRREAAYNVLVEKVKKIDPLADKSFVAKKINSLRSAFRKEFRKTEMMVGGMSLDEVYKPKLWYFDHLLFLTDQEAPMMAQYSLAAATDEVADDDDGNHDDYYECGEEADDVEGMMTSPVVKMNISQIPEVQSGRPQTPSPRPSSSASSASRFAPSQFKRQKKDEDKSFTTVRENLCGLQREDQFDIFGRNVAAKLRLLPQEQRIYAEKKINDALFEAELQAFQQGNECS